MPTYDYRCKACEHQFEHFQSMKSRLLRKCPECGEVQLERLIGTGAGLIFKGSGFYITDYRDSSYKKDQGADGGSTSDKKDGDSTSKKDAGTSKKDGSSEKSDAGTEKKATPEKKSTSKESSAD